MIVVISSLSLISSAIVLACFESYTLLLIVIVATIIIIAMIKHHGIRKLIDKEKMLSSLERSLISIGAYEDLGNYICLPKIKIDQKGSTIMIDIPDLKIRSKLEANIDIFSSAFIKGYILDDYHLSNDEKTLVMRYIDVNMDRRLIFDSYEEFKSRSLSTEKTVLFIDQDHDIDLIETNGVLVTGGTGDGKSYFTQVLILQALIKGYDVHILDIKRSYQSFESMCHCVYETKDIIDALDEVIKELEYRQKQMDAILKSDPRSLAIDAGFPVVLLVVEEYMALMSAANKKEQDEIENKLKRLVITGRALNISVIVVTQVAMASSLSSAIRSNLALKMVFGNASRTIYETTFGIGSVPKITTDMQKGQGLMMRGIKIAKFSAPTLNFDIVKYLQ